jgi:amino acid transporter
MNQGVGPHNPTPSGSSYVAGELQHNAIGLPSVVAQGVTHMAPAISVGFALTGVIAFAGAGAPLSMLIGIVGCLLVGSCVAQLVRHMPSAGYYMSYLGKSMGRDMGFLAAWAVLSAEVIIPSALYVVLAPILNSVLQEYFGVSVPIWICIIFLVVVVTGVTYLGIRTSSRVAIVLALFEVVVFFVVGVALIIHAGSHNTLSVFSPSAPGVVNGWSGIFKGMIFAIFMFLGFETSAPLAEETRHPRRNIPLAIFIATIGIGLLYTLGAYSGVVGWGIHSLASYATSSDPWIVLAKKVIGWGWIFVFIALLNSTYANAQAGTNGGSRAVFAMGRAGLLPGRLSNTHPRFRTPAVAIVAVGVLNGAIALAAGIGYGGFNAYFLLGEIQTLFFIALFVVACLAVPVYYYRYYRTEFNVALHLVIPIAGAILFLFPIYFSVVPLPTYPVVLAPFIALGWLILGFVMLGVLRSRRSQALDNATTVLDFERELEPEAAIKL